MVADFKERVFGQDMAEGHKVGEVETKIEPNENRRPFFFYVFFFPAYR